MSRKRGQPVKKINIEQADDAKIIEETKTSEGSLLTDPSAIEGEFAFEKPPTSESIPLNVPLAGETSQEGQTMKNLGFDVSDLGDMSDIGNSGGGSIPPNNNGKTISMDDAIGDGGDNFGGGIIDDVPPPSPNEKDLFDEVVDGEEGEGGGGSMSIPPDFIEWAAEKQAEWIVSTEKILIEGFMQNRARISTIDVRQRLLKYGIDHAVSKEIMNHVNSYNSDVDTHLELSKDAQKVLRMSWTAVLKQHSNIAENITPEAALLINHLLIGGQLWVQGNELKKYGKDLLADIDSILKSNSPKQPKEKGESN